MIRAAFVTVLLLILGAACNGFAVPLESLPGPSVQGNDSPVVISGVGGSSQPSATPVATVGASSVPAGDPLVGGAGGEALAPKIPKFPVEMFVRQGTNSRFELFFLDVKYGYDLQDFQFYNAWCLKKGAPLPGGTVHDVRLYNGSDPDMPAQFKSMWPRLNYLINHKTGSKEDIQEAVWRLSKSPGHMKMSAKAARLLRQANLKGKDYKPATGDMVAILCKSLGNQQPIFIEFKLPPRKPAAVKAAFFAAPLAALGGLGSTGFVPVLAAAPAALLAGGSGSSTSNTTSVPEPSSLVLFSMGMFGVLLSRNVRRRLQCRV